MTLVPPRAFRSLAGAVLALTLFAALGCAPPRAGFAHAGPARSIALAVFATSGAWTASGFAEALSDELRKYNIDVEDVAESLPSTAAVVRIGAWTDRAGFGRSIRVDLYDGSGTTAVGEVRVPPPTHGGLDFDATLYAAAPEVALLIAHALRDGA